MTTNIKVDSELLQQFYVKNILFSFNSPPPTKMGMGWMRVGDTVQLFGKVTLESNAALYAGAYSSLIGGQAYCGLCTIGSFSYSYSPLPEPLIVGRYCSISSGLRFLDSTHPTHTLTTSALLFRPHNRLFRDVVTERLRSFSRRFNPQGEKGFPRIDHDVWIGANVTLGMGITIGTGAIVASGTVVTKDVPPYAIVAGNPGEIKGYRFGKEDREALLLSKWWEYDPRYIFDLDFEKPMQICKAIETQNVPRFSPPYIELPGAFREVFD